MGIRRYSMYVLMTLLLIAFFLTAYVLLFHGKDNEKEIRENQYKRVAEYTEQFNAKNLDVMFYGMAPNGPENLNCRYVNTIQEALDSWGGNSTARMLIICDQNTSCFVQPEEFEALKERIMQGNFYLVYFGTAKYQMMIDAGLITGIGKKDKKSIIFWYKNGGMHIGDGFVDDTSLLPFYVQQDLAPEQVPVYNMIFEMVSKQLYW
ncbi:MAG: hypothetical protein IK125_00940 [Lachnospiraceae bacterium]|nr:hypothetical protein [Lachnospiraceae bacterium]